MTPVVIGDCRLFLGDCIEVMRGFPDCFRVDAAWTDPPYNVGKDYGGHNDSMPEDEYFAWCEQWLAELLRRTDRVSLYPPKKHLRWFWNRVPTAHQIICGWSPAGAIRGGWVHQYAPLLLSAPRQKMTPDHWWNVQIPGLGYFFREETYGHPGKTSDDITTRVLTAVTERGETVLDCFMGTGTTGAIAAQLGRKFVGIERNPEYFDIACQRIEESYKQRPLFEAAPQPKPQQMGIEA
jgi:hypothetical protein